MEKLEIKKGWYWSAGTKYGWASDGHAKEGIGINRSLLYNNDELEVVVKDTHYLLDTKQAIDFVRKYKSHYSMPGGTKIGVISKSILTEK